MIAKISYILWPTISSILLLCNIQMTAMKLLCQKSELDEPDLKFHHDQCHYILEYNSGFQIMHPRNIHINVSITDLTVNNF